MDSSGLVVVSLALAGYTAPSDGEATRSGAPSIVIPAPSAPATSSAPAAGTGSASASAAAAPAARLVAFSITSFASGSLDQCLDFSIELPASSSLTVAQAADALAEQFVKAAKDGTRLPGTCAETLKDRVQLAACTAQLDLRKLGEKKPGAAKVDPLQCDPSKDKGCSLDLTAPKPAMLQLIERYYLFERVSTDEMLKQCLEIKGKWEALPQDSDAFRNAKREAARRDLERLSKKLGQ